jgi:chromosome partitioning protein
MVSSLQAWASQRNEEQLPLLRSSTLGDTMSSTDADTKRRSRKKAPALKAASKMADDPPKFAVEQPVSHVVKRRTVLVNGPKGGLGKTTLVRNLAVAAARTGLRVALADLDPQQTLLKWWSRRPEGLAEVSVWAAEPSDSQELLDVIDGQDFDVLIIDTPPGLEKYPEDVQRLIEASDLLLIPCGPSSDESESVVPWMEYVGRFGKPAAFVLTRVDRRSTSVKETKLELNAIGRLCPIEIPQSEDIKRASKIGIGVQEIAKAFGAPEIEGVWAFVCQELGLKKG